MNKMQLSQFVKDEALNRGFSYCGIAKARRLDEHEPFLVQWLKEGRNGTMQYMENNFEKRLDPRLLVDGARSIISLMMNYFPENYETYSSSLKVSKYARNMDYHVIIKNRLFDLVERLKAETGDFNYRVFVDSAPILDRAWAVEAGIGWVGKNSMLLSRKNGSFYFLAEVVCDLDLEYNIPNKGSYCGNCTRCIDACPTKAITSPGKLDANRCISYLTIEFKQDIENDFKGQFNNWIFGCDICQDVCPWNRFSILHDISEFKSKAQWTEWTIDDWQQMDEPLFKTIFYDSAIQRAGFRKLKNSINFVTIFN